MENKLEAASTLNLIGYIIVGSADIFKNKWVLYGAIAVAAATLIVITMAIVQFRKLPTDAPDRKRYRKKLIYRGFVLAALIVLDVLTYRAIFN